MSLNKSQSGNLKIFKESPTNKGFIEGIEDLQETCESEWDCWKGLEIQIPEKYNKWFLPASTELGRYGGDMFKVLDLAFEDFTRSENGKNLCLH